jgi:L-arabinonolactonase
MRIEKLDTVATTVGEGPVWDNRSQSLFFVDVDKQALHRFDTRSGKTRSWDAGQPIGSLALREGGGAILSLKKGLFSLDFQTGVIEAFALTTEMDPQLQLNDGKTDRRGRFLVGGGDFIHTDMHQIAPLFSLDAGANLRILETGIGMTNGPCWSPDDSIFYFSDSSRSQVYAYDYEIETGSVANRRPFASTAALGGVPDGATVDKDGLVWIAICGAGKIVAYRPDGRPERVIEMPCAYPTSVMLGGEHLDQLFVTSLDARFLNAPEDSGGATFVISGLGAVGIPDIRFAG